MQWVRLAQVESYPTSTMREGRLSPLLGRGLTPRDARVVPFANLTQSEKGPTKFYFSIFIPTYILIPMSTYL